MYYVIQVRTGHEEKVIQDIKKYKNHDFSFDVFSPFRKELRKCNGEYKEVSLRCFPGYLFVQTDDVEQLFYDLYWVPHFTKILGREGITTNFVPLNKDESRIIDILYGENVNRTTVISDIVVEEGNKIRAVSGPLMGQEGVIKKVDLHKRVVTIEIMLAGRAVEAKLGINIITKID